jgi:itaconate CoA-transferase
LTLSSRPLSDLTVVALEQAVAAPFATRQLADLGARVVKIERPQQGDFARGYDRAVRGMASYFVWLNRSKESLTLDVKHADGRVVLDRLLTRADVFVQNLGPGAAERLGLDAASLRPRFPRLIVCSISGYGSSGPYRDRKAYDLLIQSEAGLLSVTGTPETPSKAGISIADIAAGMYAYSAILTALLCRERTGEGRAIEVAMLDALGEWMGNPMYFARYGGAAPQRTGASHPSIAPYGPFAGSDRQPVYFGIQNEREWQRFCAVVLERPELGRDPRFASNADRTAHRADLHAVIDEAFAHLTADAIVDRLQTAAIAFARMNTMHDFASHPQLAARNRWREIASPVGPLDALVPPADIEGVEPVMGAVPALGEQTDRILSELGFAPASIAQWRERGLV